MVKVKVIQDIFYTKNFEDEEVFSLQTEKDGGLVYSRTYTISGLKEIADTINVFLEGHKEKQNANS